MKIQIASPAPVLNTPDFPFAFGGHDGNSIPTNEKGHPYHFEFVALKGMIFEVVARWSEHIVRVSHPSYPEPDIFLDLRFTWAPMLRNTPQLPTPTEILEKMVRMLGKPYVWGGNWSPGIPELLALYPPKAAIDAKTKTLWTLDGVDCSGLLYEATGGATPRNTSQLVHLGQPLPIQNLSPKDIVPLLKPLDMILYKGHVLFVLDPQTTIESKSPFGVISRNLRERLDEISSEKEGTNIRCDEWDSGKQFMIRRFI
jgi:hypothetical protein